MNKRAAKELLQNWLLTSYAGNTLKATGNVHNATGLIHELKLLKYLAIGHNGYWS